MRSAVSVYVIVFIDTQNCEDGKSAAGTYCEFKGWCRTLTVGVSESVSVIVFVVKVHQKKTLSSRLSVVDTPPGGEQREETEHPQRGF